jgi:hypothetical protein
MNQLCEHYFPKLDITVRSDGFVKTDGVFWRGHIVTKYFYRQVESPALFKRKFVHILVAHAFIPNPNPKLFREVDHIDADPSNNRVGNLRWVSKTLNHAAMLRIGCYYDKRYKYWTARCTINKKRRNLGYYQTKVEASRVYRAFKGLAFRVIYLSCLPKERRNEAGHRQYIRADEAAFVLGTELLMSRVRGHSKLRKEIRLLLDEYPSEIAAVLTKNFQP